MVVAEVPDEEPVTTILNGPRELNGEAERNNAVVHVSVQVGEENCAVTPGGSADVVNETRAADPESRVAEMSTHADCPCTIKLDDKAADREKAEAGGATGGATGGGATGGTITAAAVVKV